MIFLIRTEEDSAFWTILHALIIEAAIVASDSDSFAQISTRSQISSLPSSQRKQIKGSQHCTERGEGKEEEDASFMS